MYLALLQGWIFNMMIEDTTFACTVITHLLPPDTTSDSLHPTFPSIHLLTDI